MVDPAKCWLIGGGVKELCTYGVLASAVAAVGERRPESVADVLVQLARAAWRGGRVVLSDLSFAGEGTSRWRGEAGPGTMAPLPLVFNENAVIEVWSSGSTGEPKAVRHRVVDLARNLATGPRHRDDIWGLAYNPTHIAGVQVYLQALANGNTVVNLWGTAPDEWVARCREHGVTHLSATPTFYRMFLAAEPDVPSLRSITLGGEAADAALIANLRRRFPQARVHNIYASTEAGTVLTSDGVEFQISAEQAGRVRIVDGRLWLHRSLIAGDGGTVRRWDGETVVDGEAVKRCDGETVADGETVKRCDGEAADSEPDEAVKQFHGLTENGGGALKGSLDEDQGQGANDWYDTGDVVEFSSEDPTRFRIVGRSGEQINVGGEKVSPAEVESALLSHPNVLMARVTGRRNSVVGQIVVADFVPRGIAPSEAELRAYLGERLAAFKVPRIIRCVETLELTRTGKVRR